MLGLIQRVTHARVEVDELVIGEIGEGLLLFLGVERNDTRSHAEKLLAKILEYRVFSDEQGKMNLGLRAAGGSLLVVSQFTLAADTRKGLRPSFTPAAPPSEAEALYHYFVEQAEEKLACVACGEFGANMQVTLCNEGPVTFLLKS